jgi:hypothetical protein
MLASLAAYPLRVGSRLTIGQSLAPEEPEATISALLPLARPGEAAVMVAVPEFVAVKLTLACPAVGLIGEVGVKVPATPVTEKLMGLLALPTVLPAASCMIAA